MPKKCLVVLHVKEYVVVERLIVNNVFYLVLKCLNNMVFNDFHFKLSN